MDHHFSWFLFIPGYSSLINYLQKKYSFTVIFNNGILPSIPRIETVHHVYSMLGMIFFFFIIYFFLNYYIKKNKNDIIIPFKKVTILNILEYYFEIIINLMKDVLGSEYKNHIVLIFTLSFFILISNLSGLIPGFLPSTDNLNTTLSCSLLVFFYFNYHGFKNSGINHILHIANPLNVWWGWFLSPLMFPVELIGLCIRPISLSVRLACNILADHKVLFAFTSICPFLLPLPFFFLGLLVSIIQTVVFCLLTCVYISLHSNHNNH